MSRLENLLGACSLALADRLLAGVEASGAPSAGVSSSESAALVTLMAHPGRTVGWLGEVLGLTTSGVTRLVERLVRADMVERNTGPDARSRRLTLTPAGGVQGAAILTGRESTLSRALATLDATEQGTLEALLDKMVGGVTGDRLAALRVCRLCDRAACRDGGHTCPLQHTVADGATPDG
jgi:DNA-binding MarR family transcriptional regulator